LQIIYPSHVRDANSAAFRILSQKKHNWEYEREWRVLGPVGEVPISGVQAVKRIFLGSRVSPSHRKQILEKIQGTSIKAYMMEVDGYEHTWEEIDMTARPKRKSK
jgi:hypothetical protein